MDKKQYIIKQALDVIILTILVFLFSFFVNQLLCLIAFPFSGGESINGLPQYYQRLYYNEEILFADVAIKKPYLYNLLYSTVFSILGGGIALLTYALGTLKIFKKVNPLFLAVGVFLAFIFLSLVGMYLHIPAISFFSYVQTGQSVSLLECMIFIASIYLLGVVVLGIGRRNYEYL